MIIDAKSSAAALLAFAGWTKVHVILIAGYRSLLINTGREKPSAFSPSRHEAQDTFIGRVSCAHANCVENLPLFTAVILANFMVDGAPDVSGLAWKYVYCRLAQSLTHWYSVSDMGVTVRFICFAMGKWFLGSMAYRTIMG